MPALLEPPEPSQIEALCRSIEPAGSWRVDHRTLLIVASDPRSSGLVAEPATFTAATAIFDGSAAVAQAARVGGATIIVIDAGCARTLPPPAIALPGSLDAGAAVVVSIAEATGLDLLLLGVIGGPRDAAIDLVTGAILAAASLHARVVLDGDATGAAAVAAVALQPAVRSYLVAPHRNNVHLATLGLEPVLDVGLGHGEGAGAAMVLPFIDRLARAAQHEGC